MGRHEPQPPAGPALLDPDAARRAGDRGRRAREPAHLAVQLAWPPADADALVVAVDEAVANCIEHAYHGRAAGEVVLVARVESTPEDGRRIRLEVRDHGRWRAPRPGSRGPSWGLELQNALMADVRIEHHRDSDGTDTGTSVVLTTPDAPPAA